MGRGRAESKERAERNLKEERRMKTEKGEAFGYGVSANDMG